MKKSGFKQILFILPVPTQPRFRKRIKHYLDSGYAVTVASFERDYFEKNKLPDVIDYVSLGKVEHGAYLKRIPKVILSIKKLIPLINSNKSIFFFTPELFVLLSPFLGSKSIIYEIGDLRQMNHQTFFEKVFHIMYKRALERCDVINVTSVGFMEHMIEKYDLPPKKFEVIENKLLRTDFPIENRGKFQARNELSIGIVGLFRYENILNFVREFNRSDSNHRIILFGDGPLKEQILQFVDGERIRYKGQFQYPSDLYDIYHEIDLSFTMYNAEDLNVRLALPNKLYESIYFQTPILVSKNTFLEKKVMEFGIGFSWDQEDMTGLISWLNSTQFLNNFNELGDNFSKIPAKEYLE